ncbi:putative transcriptional corepressor of histone genes (Hir3) [Aspergillus ibericus CBS 121593]|uniref:Histone transcription regulator 3 homolog n=1 Tax=Aspergillus ibericus CBS 121593 TaxID=1448316 RepID=A0A395GSX3_9EURO|nr:transcriptional corepressor of histone genes [Aspergillus ibericus CBS 121593]RAK98284.1 transcriptional corepressor of histone genes [Aspergillus ibericus CBS 121593]
MSSWVALNIEPDEAVEEEVDDTKEIQIEEALKLYQNALKLHSQGPQFYAQAAEAYDALLESEIFKYPESISDYKRNAFQDPELQYDDAAGAGAAQALAEFDISDSTSSTLMQTIYLSYKNHGQYVLDALRASLQGASKSPGAGESQTQVTEKTSAALTSFAEALERDDSDLNLWRQSARLCSALQSYRLTRYCLESVLADDDNRLEVRTEQLGLEETFAEERLRGVLRSLLDRLSLAQVPLKKPKRALLKFLQRQADPYPYLPILPLDLEDTNPSKNPLALRGSRHEIKPVSPTWAAVGKSILQRLVEEDLGASETRPGTSIGISLPALSPEMRAIGSQRRASNTLVNDIKSSQQQDVTMSEETQPTVKSECPDAVVEQIDDHSSIDQRAEKQLMESLEIQSTQPHNPGNQQETANAEEADLKPHLSGRKRSSASAVTEDQADRIRAKARRTRLREATEDVSFQAEEVTLDLNKYYEDRLEGFTQADEWLFGTAGSLLSKLGVEDLGVIDDLRKQVCSTNESNDSANAIPPGDTGHLLARDLMDIMRNWDEAKSQVMHQPDNLSTLQDIRGMGKSGLAIFLEHSRKSTRKLGMKQVLSGEDELYMFLRTVNNGWFHVHEVSLCWLKTLLMPDFARCATDDMVPPDWPVLESAYTLYQWPDALKETVVQLLLREDEHIYKHMREQIDELENRILSSGSETPFTYTLQHFAELEMLQTLFELHLDIYASINNPNSEVDGRTRLMQRDRLERWCLLARTSLTHFLDYSSPSSARERVVFRHIWASTFHSNMARDIQREHVLLCLQELKFFLASLKNPVISLVNNAVMPELSSEAVDQEISKLKSMDFFMRIFNPTSDDPVGLIETIEPILEPSSVQFVQEGLDEEESEQSASQLREMGSFLDRGDASLRLFLWRRLQDAYKKIEYPPKVVSCYLRSIETILRELQSPAHLEEPNEHRQITLLRWLKSLDSILNKAVTTILHESDKAYECFDMEHLKSSMSAVAHLTKLLHSFALYEDLVRVGKLSGPDLRGALAKSLESLKDKLREMQVRCWILQYTLIKEAITQNQEAFDTPLEDRIHYLRSVHNALGIRRMCRFSHKQFLKLVRSEIFTLDVKQDVELDICQILYDIYGIKLSPVDGLLYDHGCPPEKLDRSTAIVMVDFVMRQAKKMNIKDLSKSELKSTIDKMQQAIGTTKSSPPLSYNKRIITAYLKSPINPSGIFRAIQGVADLPLIPVPAESAVIARNGWYFLLGHAALTKFRSQKRLNPVPTTDLDDAITWFRQDLEHGTSRWETWYRLAQTYDSKLEEDITWSADKINNNRMELVTWQRNAIHCYSMAIATAIKHSAPTLETRAMLSDLFTDFGIRLYSSSRAPLSMGAFSLADFTRHFSNKESQRMYEGRPFKEMKLYSVWNLASYLLRRALVDKPKNWMTHYMLSKCLWKMYSCDESVRGAFKRIDVDVVLDSLLDAIDALPQRKDSRSDPIFEPHYKLVSIVHKLVHRGDLTAAEGSKTLLATPWARKVQPPEDQTAWKRYILDVLRNLKSADKSNWHHRMAVRAAHVIYDDDKDSAAAAAAAKNELTQQIFTKTMTIQVWRPEFERPGRHFVYTTRYAYFFVSLLDQLDDRVNLDQLLRRVRKKQGDFINHGKLWEDASLTYARVIRRAGHISEGHEEGVFKPIGWEEFVANTARLEGLLQLALDSPSLLELLRDAIELKKLNNNLMKVALLEDLIADLYARLYEINMPQVIEQANEENKEKMKVDHLLMGSDGAADTPTPPTSAPASEAPAPRGRTKGIARRDVQKRAETIVNRKVAPRVLTAKAPASTEAEQANTSEAAPTSAPKPIKPDLLEPVTEELGSGQQSDIPNSLHDSADDESELSEIDDEKLSKLTTERKLLFPNLDDRGSMDPESEVEGTHEMAGDMEEEGDREGDTELIEGEGETMVEEAEDVADGEDDDLEGEDENEAGGDEEMEGEGEGEGEGDDEGEGDLEDDGEGNDTVEMEGLPDGEDGEGDENDDDVDDDAEQPEIPGTDQESDNGSEPEPMES